MEFVFWHPSRSAVAPVPSRRVAEGQKGTRTGSEDCNGRSSLRHLQAFPGRHPAQVLRQVLAKLPNADLARSHVYTKCSTFASTFARLRRSETTSQNLR